MLNKTTRFTHIKTDKPTINVKTCVGSYRYRDGSGLLYFPSIGDQVFMIYTKGMTTVRRAAVEPQDIEPCEVVEIITQEPQQ